MDNTQVSFQQVLNATLRMLRTTWKTKVSLFMQLDDHGDLIVRAADGLPKGKLTSLTVKMADGPFAKCFSKNRIVETPTTMPMGNLGKLIKPLIKKDQKFAIVPVSGETRVLGVLFLGPFPKSEKIHHREAELRSAGALCAVLSAHWRMYEWMSSFAPQLNHEIRTPLTAIQGSIGMVLGGLFGNVGPDVKEMLEMAQKGCERTVRAIEQYVNTQNPPKNK
jgi:transcriptional regulator with GAF, ATPase, and Fis domain